MQSAEKLSIYKKLSADLFSGRCKYMIYTSSHKTDSEMNQWIAFDKAQNRVWNTKILQTTKITEELQEISYKRYTDFINQIFKSYNTDLLIHTPNLHGHDLIFIVWTLCTFVSLWISVFILDWND